MNKTELINAMAEKTGLTKTDSKKALDAFMETVHAELKKGEKVSVIGFGTWNVVKREKRQGVNPFTGKKMTIKAKKVAKFKAGKGLDL